MLFDDGFTLVVQFVNTLLIGINLGWWVIIGKPLLGAFTIVDRLGSFFDHSVEYDLHKKDKTRKIRCFTGCAYICFVIPLLVVAFYFFRVDTRPAWAQVMDPVEWDLKLS